MSSRQLLHHDPPSRPRWARQVASYPAQCFIVEMIANYDPYQH